MAFYMLPGVSGNGRRPGGRQDLQARLSWSQRPAPASRRGRGSAGRDWGLRRGAGGDIMEMLFPHCRVMRLEEIYGDLSFPGGTGERPYTAINMVTTVDGKASVGGAAYALGSKVDHLVMRRIRAAVDGVAVGAETLRKENVNPTIPPDLQARRAARGMTPQPAAIVITATADLPVDRTFFQAGGLARVVITTESAPKERVSALEPYSTVLRLGLETVDLRAMMRALVQDLGIRRLVVEGGPTLNSALIAEGLVDELFWTAAPKILGGAAMRTMVEGKPLALDRIPRLDLASLFHHEGELFARYRFPA